MRAQGFELDDVPPAGTWVKLALTGNMSTGGTSIDRTIEAHPDNVEIAETAARIVGLDVAGIDFICPDIATPVRETGGAIVEVNAAPGFRMHTHPTEGEPQYVARPVIDWLFPAGLVGAHPDRQRDRHERQDHDRPDDRPHPQAHGPSGRDDLDRRHRRRRPAHQEGRHVGPQVGPDGAPEPDRGHGRLRGRARRHPARGARLRPQRRRGRDQRLGRPPGPGRDHVAGPAGQREGRGRRGRAALRDRGAQRRRPPRLPDGPPLRRAGRAVQHGHREGPGRLRPHRRAHQPWQRGVLPRAEHRRRADRPPPGQPQDAGAVHAPDPGHVRRPRPDERGERPGRGRRGVGRRRAPARHPPGPADLLDLVLPGARPAEPARRRRRARRDRLLPQRRRHAPARRFRDPDDGRATDQGRAHRDVKGPGARVGPGDRRARHPGRSPRRGPARLRGDRRGRVRRDHRARGQEPARPGGRRDAPRTSSRASARPRRPGPRARPGPTRCSRR